MHFFHTVTVVLLSRKLVENGIGSTEKTLIFENDILGFHCVLLERVFIDL